ncbi:MAG: hypothetical protein HRT98_00375 [Mycoplasmatales bacterium]|nr:hypothetical protein [Mycoplasmatales bacterium]
MNKKLIMLAQWLFKTELYNSKKIIKTHKKMLKSRFKITKIFYKGLQMKWTNKSSSFISSESTFGEGTILAHGAHGIHIRKTNFGKKCIVMPGVSIISTNKSRVETTIGDFCILGSNSTIISDITIGDNVTIGANAVVTKDVPSNSIIVGTNKIISNNNNNEEEIENILKVTNNYKF